MKTNPDDQAMPVVVPVNEMNEVYCGMTKREYFAAVALQGLLVSSKDTIEYDTKLAVQHADALISALNEVKP